MSVLLDSENCVGSPSYKCITIRGRLAFIKIMNVFFITMKYKTIIKYLILIWWPSFLRDLVLIISRRKNSKIHLEQRKSTSNELAGKQSALYNWGGKKHKILRRICLLTFRSHMAWYDVKNYFPSVTMGEKNIYSKWNRKTMIK